MPSSHSLTRRQFVRLVGVAAAGALLDACKPAFQPVPEEPESPSLSPLQKGSPAVIKPRKVQIQIDGWAVPVTNEVLTRPSFVDFTKQTGIEIEFIPRMLSKQEELSQLAAAVKAGTAPYDIIDFEDELTTYFSQAGYMLSLNDLLPSNFWDDFPASMKAYSDIWSTRQDELFRVVHNWEMPYWWYRKDWFDARGIALPQTWDEVRTLGKVFTDESKGVWASEDSMIKGGYLNVYLSWITLQAGGNPYDIGDEYKTALQYIYDLMYTDKVLNPASLDTQILQQNSDYCTDKMAYMRQWPFFYDTATGPDYTAWFKEDKIAVALPPVGPGGKGNSTFTASWGFGIPKTAPNLDAAKEVFKFIVSPEIAAEMAGVSVWYVSARKSVLAAIGDKGIAKFMKMYSDAGVIGVRPFHPQFMEAETVLEDAAMPYLRNEISLDESIKLAKEGMAKLG